MDEAKYYTERKEPKYGEKVVRGLIVGRDKKIIPPNEVEHLASLGCSDRDIAEYYAISESTLRYNFSDFLVKGRHQLKTTLRQKQLQVALEGHPTMLIWLGKQYLGQGETQHNVGEEILPFSDDELDEVRDQAEQELEELDNGSV